MQSYGHANNDYTEKYESHSFMFIYATFYKQKMSPVIGAGLTTGQTLGYHFIFITWNPD